MPKLTSQNMAKRFKCDQCGASFRNRAGLSGHIQFKHDKSKPPIDFKDTKTMLLQTEKMRVLLVGAGLSETDSQERSRILFDWTSVLMDWDLLGLEPNIQDFKNYLIRSYTLLFQNKQLEDRLMKRVRSLLEEYKQNNPS